MVRCSICQKPIEKLPEWLSGTTIQFVCLNCPKKQNKNPAYILPSKDIISLEEAELLKEEPEV